MDSDSRATVLYVDDEPLACKYFERAFAARYRVLTAPSVDTALALLQDVAGEVDVLVTDYRMPDRLGSDLLQEVVQRYPHIVCMLVTAYADKDVLLELLNGGTLFRLLEKPLDMAAMQTALQLAVQAGRERTARRQGLVAMEESLAFLAHELNTPLAAIANFARGIERRAQGTAEAQAEIAEAAALMHGNARYCLSVLASFIDTVRLASSGPGMQDGRRAGSARQLLAALLDSYPLSAQQRAAIQVEVQEDFAIAESPNCVSLIVSSVLGKALRSVEEQAEPALTISIGAGTIKVRDNGAGIAPEIVEQLLLDPVSADSGEGKGWGMVFCRRMMQSFGGNLDIASEFGSSTTVTLNFPVHIRNEHD